MRKSVGGIKELDAARVEATQAQTHAGRIHRGQKPGAGTRWLAMPRLRCHEGLAGSSHETEKPTRRGRDAKSDYALRQFSWKAPPRAAPIQDSLGRRGEDRS